ncbi:protein NONRESPONDING TO OXYLIPINS 2, mitochondrial isoform X2 [Lotus japonicus]|uniref:protein NONRESPONDING TO OXYLIPINS 2, mitochondrial isoform X2 n=1 Tax=Lotus japonicus TaxID=34305 RepID=UPI002589DAA7|nr:protein NONRESPONDING TO OXYLIPINS 2, mitochondrial isoform X2 [Lotus japonicus]
MASRYRSFSQPAMSLIKSTITKPTTNPKPSPFLFKTRSSSSSTRSVAELGCVQSLLPLHSAVSSARLTSCLGIDSRTSRSLSQEMGLSTPR